MTLDNLTVAVSQNRDWASQQMSGLVKPELSGPTGSAGTGNTASLALCPPPQNSCNPPPGLRPLGDTRPWAPALLTHFPDNICNKKSKQRPLTTAKAKTNLENSVMIAQDSTSIIGVD